VILHVRQAQTFSWPFVFIPLEFMFFLHTVRDRSKHTQKNRQNYGIVQLTFSFKFKYHQPIVFY